MTPQEEDKIREQSLKIFNESLDKLGLSVDQIVGGKARTTFILDGNPGLLAQAIANYMDINIKFESIIFVALAIYQGELPPSKASKQYELLSNFLASSKITDEVVNNIKKLNNKNNPNVN